MENTYIRNLISKRLGGDQFGKTNEIWKFEKIKRAKQATIEKYPHIPIIDLGVGEPDSMVDARIVEELAKEAAKWENRDYADNGIEEFNLAAINYMKEVFGVENLDECHVNHCIGTKSGLGIIAQAFIDPGDITLTTVPGYPITGMMTKWLGGEVYELPLLEENDFFPDFKKIPKEILNRAKILYINYPNNPTGKVATVDFYKEVIKFAKTNNIIVVQDAAYAAITFDRKPLSFLSVEGAKEVGVEFHSMSKAFNMTGWRMGFVVGDDLVVSAFKTAKDFNDAGQFKAIQKACIYALNHPQITESINIKYKRRHEKLAKILNKLGFNARGSKGSFYQYVKIPKRDSNGILFESAEQFSEYLISKAQISTVPWDEAGQYVRFSITFVAKNLEEEDKIFNELYDRLERLNLEF